MVGSNLAEPVRDIQMTGRLGKFGGGATVRDRDRRVSSGRQEQLDHLGVAVLRGLVERRVPTVLRRIHVGTGREQQSADLDVTPRRSRVERLVRQVVDRVILRERGPAQQHGHRDAARTSASASTPTSFSLSVERWQIAYSSASG